MLRSIPLLIALILHFALPVNEASAATCAPTLAIVPQAAQVANGGNVGFTLGLTNTGTGTCSGVYFSLYYPDELSFVSASPASTAGGYYWNFPSLSAGQTRTILLTTKAQTGQALPRSTSLDGCLNAGGIDVCSAGSVMIAATSATPTPSISPTPTATPIPTPSATPPTTPTPTPSASATPIPSAPPVASGPERGIWFWDRTLPIGQTKINDIIATAQLYGFNAVYYTVEDYGMYKAQNNQAKIQQMRDALKTLCSQLHAKSIRCDAVTGEPDFGEQAGFGKALDIADFILDYNRNAAGNERVDILQYDVEPHVLSRYERNKANVLGKYVAMVDAVVTRVKDGNAHLRVDIVAPHFFDSVQNWTPAIAFKGKTQHTFDHVMDSLERLPGGRYHVMAYRRATGGGNGSIALSRTEVETASASYPNTKVVVSQETGNFSPVTTISFYGLCRSALENALVQIANAFADESGFGGFSIHSFATYKALGNC